jgi:Ni/Fe-hydrogenase 1 B-type cytochrome subunit
MRYERHFCWGILLRLFHWSFALSIVALVVTGFYIHYPWTNTLIEGETTFPVGTMRYIHFVAGFVFTGAILARLYLLIFGNRQERIWDFLPVTPKNIRNMLCTMGFYMYCNIHEHRLGHNVLAGTFYLVTFILALLQLIGGFYLLYPESTAWQKLGLFFLGPQQQARLIHYLIMWYFMIFAFIHVYIVIWNDIKTKEGLISSIFNGRKYTPSQ